MVRDETATTGGLGTGRAFRLGPIAVLASLLLAACDDATPAPVPVTVTPAPQASQAPQSSQPPAAQAALTASGVPLSNDPSAPADTPLCGIAAREANVDARTLLSRQYASAGICSSFACYDAATATYIGADGYRHVCR